MADDLLAQLDDRFAAARSGLRDSLNRRRASVEETIDPAIDQAATTSRRKPMLRTTLPWLTLFMAAQFLWGALLFLPGAQAYRPVVRALPYAFSLGLLAIYVTRIVKGRSPRGTLLVTFALALLVANLLHPTSQLGAGIAQCVFQFTIAAPMFWGWKAVDTTAELRRLLVLAFVFNTAGAALGVLQVYYPDQFMPPEFNSLGSRMNELYVESLTYVGASGERIIRPPGLSDQPGGAAQAGALTVVLGAGLFLMAGSSHYRALTLAAVGVGLAAIYLTQVRSLLLMSVGALFVMALLLVRRGEVRTAGRIAISAAVLVVAAFFWARTLGGESVEERFVGIAQQGAMRSYQENRGGFVSDTFGELLDQYPFGAGVGRWGMMHVYFANPDNVESFPIHVEIQLTGWLLDGGVPMWILYGGAIVMAILASYRLALRRFNQQLAETAIVVLALQVLIAGFGWAGPVFNTQLGILFWFLTSTLHGATREPGPAVPASRTR